MIDSAPHRGLGLEPQDPIFVILLVVKEKDRGAPFQHVSVFRTYDKRFSYDTVQQNDSIDDQLLRWVRIWAPYDLPTNHMAWYMCAR